MKDPRSPVNRFHYLMSGTEDARHRALNAIADKVLAYRPKPKSKPARRRKRRKKKIDEAS